MIVITGGGTGGHLSIAKAIKTELNKEDIKPIYIGSNYGQDRAWFESDEGFCKKFFFETNGVVNQGFLGKIVALGKIALATLKTMLIFRKHRVKKVFCVGGYSSAPASFASIILRCDLYIHEQNAVVGRLNNILKPFAKEFFSSYFDSKTKNYPVSEIFFDTQRVREEFKTIIFLGGSQGATAVNNLALKFAKYLKKNGFKIIHQTGKNDFERVREKYERLEVEADVFAFDKNLSAKIAKADFAVSRSGASTLWELIANAIPTLFIPYPYASANHQYENAKFLIDRDLAFLKLESELFTFDLSYILDNKEKLMQISRDLTKIIDKNGAKDIARFLI